MQAKRQQGYICFTKTIHDHILEAFYKTKYLERVENINQAHDEQQTSATNTCKHIQIGEIPCSQELKEPENRILTGVGNMGETMCKYKNAYNVHQFLEKCPFNPTTEGEDGISWQEIFIVYKLCGGKGMLNKPCNGAKKRASIHKQLEAFKKCAKNIINNGMIEADQDVFKPNENKKARLETFGITTRVATIQANINLTKEAQTEVNKTLLTMQKDYSQKNLEKVLTGEK